MGRLPECASWTEIDQTRRVATLSFWLGEAYRGKGYMTAACGAAIAFARSRFGVASLKSRLIAGNTRSIAVLRRLGFQRDSAPCRDEGPAPGEIELEEYCLDLSKPQGTK